MTEIITETRFLPVPAIFFKVSYVLAIINHERRVESKRDP
jgi:hypothetical protein